MPAIPFRRFQREILDLYGRTRHRITTAKLRQVLGEVADLGVRSTRDLTPALVARWLRALGALQAEAQAAGIDHVTFRMLRHSFATHAPRWGLDPIRLKQVLRHTNLRTQNRYIHPDAEGLREAVSRVSFG